jgi:hypothetical protein
MRTGFDDGDAQAVALALAELARARPGWELYLGEIADRVGLRGHYDEFRRINADPMAEDSVHRSLLFTYLAGIAAGTFARARDQLLAGDADAALATLRQAIVFHLTSAYPDATRGWAERMAEGQAPRAGASPDPRDRAV